MHDVAPNLTLILDLDKSRCKKMSSRGEKVLVQFSQREICKEDARKGLLESMINKTAIIQDKKI